jgi:tRNA pseudouridine-54 N-methylase
MREFVLYSRKGWTSGGFKTLIDGGRLDTVYQCILTSQFLSHRIRRDVRFHAILNGPPNPPGHLTVDGPTLFDVRVDERTWEEIFRNVLSGGEHPGLSFVKESYQAVVSSLSDASIFVLEEKGAPIDEAEFSDHNVFIIGDHVGLPRAEERFALRGGTKLSIGRARYLSASTIDIINHHLDRRNI